MFRRAEATMTRRRPVRNYRCKRGATGLGLRDHRRFGDRCRRSRWRDADQPAYRQTLDQLRVSQAEASAAKSLRTEVSHLNEQLEGAIQREGVRGAQAEVATRELLDYRSHMNDIIGLEAEVASLRVVAARVPSLELNTRRRELAD